MRRDPSIADTDSPEMVHDVLINKWGIGLFRFAQVFAISPADLLLCRNEYPFSIKEIALIKQNLKIMQETLLQRGRTISEITKKLKGQAGKSMSDEELIRHMRLGKFFRKYVHNQEAAITYAAMMSMHNKRGVAINPKSIIAVGWGNLIAGKNRKMDWQALTRLYGWFWKRVEDFPFYRKLDPSKGIDNYLRTQYFRYRWKRGDILEEASLKNLKEILGLISTLFSHQVLGNKGDYISKKLSVSAPDFPRFFMNFIINSYLAGGEGLTIFSPDQAIADPRYAFLNLSLGRKIGAKWQYRLFEWMLPHGLSFSIAPELPYPNSRIKEYFGHAASLFVENTGSIKHPTPLIIFPDNSSFSASF